MCLIFRLNRLTACVMAAGLWEAGSLLDWTGSLHHYGSAVRSHRRSAKLAALDAWFMEEFCTKARAQQRRGDASFDKADLSRLMEWKLTRGSFRPRLQQFVDALPQAQVAKAATAIGAEVRRGKHRRALDAACALKGIGPATASAILSAIDPSVPFMSDEALQAVLGRKEYSAPAFEQLTEAAREKAAGLNKAAQPDGTATGAAACASSAGAAALGPHGWTAQHVELALWSADQRAKSAVGPRKQSPTKRRKPDPAEHREGEAGGEGGDDTREVGGTRSAGPGRRVRQRDGKMRKHR